MYVVDIDKYMMVHEKLALGSCERANSWQEEHLISRKSLVVDNKIGGFFVLLDVFS